MSEGNYLLICDACLVYQQLDDRLSGGLGFRGLSPVIQSDLIDTELELVIPKDPREMLDAGEFLHIPIMYGTVRDEGSLVAGCKLQLLYLTPNLYIRVFVCKR